MNKNIACIVFLAALVGAMGFTFPWETWEQPNTTTTKTTTTTSMVRTHKTIVTQVKSAPNWIQSETKLLRSQTNDINPEVLKLSLMAYNKAREQGLDKRQMLTIIDYSKPATERRLWVFDLKSGKTLFDTWVTHGKNSGGIETTSFSNNPGSLKSSLGVFVTDEPYIGKNGYSLRISGLERGFNDNAYRRSVVIHGAWYVNPDNIRNGQIGRSWGCPAVNARLATPLINAIKENTVIVAYYPDHKWLSNSKFLTS